MNICLSHTDPSYQRQSRGAPSHELAQFYGQHVLAADLTDRYLSLTLAEGKRIKIYDAADYCCERRYMQTEDALSDIVGGRLLAIEARPAPTPSYDDEDEDGPDEVTECVFLQVITTKGSITIVSYNEHNGNYSGFELAWRTIPTR